MLGIRNYLKGYKYETRVIETGNYFDLKRRAKKLNRQYKKNRRLERFAVYPISGWVPCNAQMVVLF